MKGLPCVKHADILPRHMFRPVLMMIALFWTLLFLCVPVTGTAQGAAKGNFTGDPGGSVTGNHDDVLNADGTALTSSDAWRNKGSSEPLAAALSDAVGQNRIAINIVWTLVTGYLVMFMQVGFALLECGLCRARNATHVFMTNLIVYPLCILGFWAVGFALMFGGMGAPPASLGGIHPLAGPDFHGLVGTHGFFLSVNFYDVGVFTMFLFQMVFMDTMATIPTGAMAERWRFSAFVGYALFASMFLYPLYGHWVWGGGWLANLGTWAQGHGLSLGHGAVDFAGSGVVHAVGGWAALAGAIVLGPRRGRFDNKTADHTGENGESVSKETASAEFRPHNLPMALLGTLVLAFGWFGFNPGSTLGASGGGALRIGVIATNTMLASAGGTIAAMTYWWSIYKKPNPAMCANGMLAGLVAITAPCAFVNAPFAVLIGLIAGVLVCIACRLIEQKKVDDPVGAVAVHGVCGLWGLLSVGLFADGTYGVNWNGVGDKTYLGHSNLGVTGAIYGDWGQLGAQVISCVVSFVWAFGAAYLFFRLQNACWRKLFKLPGGIRSEAPHEDIGLDISELDAPAYSDRDPSVSPRQM